MLNIESLEPQITNINKDLSSDNMRNNKIINRNNYFKKNSSNNQEINIKNQNNNSDGLNNDILQNKNRNIYSSEQVNFDVPPFRRNLIFTIFLLSDLFLNYDTGVIPASLIEITKEIELDYSEQALIGSLVYLGLSFSSVFVSLFFSNFSPSKVCSVVLLLNCLSCFIFSFSLNKRILFLMRFMMGVTEAFVTIYGPVWVNNYSPVEYSTTWMGILHSCSVIGVFLGYLVASVVINLFKGFLTWRFAIQIQGFVEIFFALFFWLEKDEYINVDIRKTIPASEIELENRDINVHYNSNVSPSINNPSVGYSFRRHDPRIDSIEISNLGRYFWQTKRILSNTLYITITLGMTSLYFIVTGIQFWITKYLIEILNTDPLIVNIIFSTISITAPLFGVLFGGTITDKYGGYKGRNESKALQMCVAFGLVSFVFAFPMGFLFQIIYLSILLWTFLFFGATMIPIGTGVMISSVPKDCQATSSSLSQLVFNLFGYFSAPMITGFIMDRFEDEKKGFIWGMRVIFWWVVIALIFFIISYHVSYSNYKKNKKNTGESDKSSMIEDNSMKDNFSNFMKLEINRRLAQGSSLL
jgi:MFS family permease